MRIIARAGPRDKQILIRGMKSNNGMIGMAGDSIADSAALIDADVGFCMGTGCDVAKDNSVSHEDGNADVARFLTVFLVVIEPTRATAGQS